MSDPTFCSKNDLCPVIFRAPHKEATSSGVSLFLEVLYTGCTCNDLEWNTVLMAMDLAHRPPASVLPLVDSSQ